MLAGFAGVFGILRFVARVLGNLALAVAVVYAVGDIARSIADDAVVLTSTTQALAVLGLSAGETAGGALAPVLALLGPLPVTLVAFGAALVLLVLGRAPRHREPMRAVH